MFGKRISEYLNFQKVALIVLAVVGLLRLALSLAGMPTSKVAFLSMNVVTWAAAIYYGIAVYTKGFGSYPPDPAARFLPDPGAAGHRRPGHPAGHRRLRQRLCRARVQLGVTNSGTTSWPT